MNQTSNYQLNQWEQSDRILMEDFNADNAKVDSALAELSGRSCLTLLKEVIMTEEASVFTVQLEDIDWNQWQAVVFDIDMLSANTTSVGTVAFSDNSNLNLGTFNASKPDTSPEDRNGPARMIFFCNGNERCSINTLVLKYDSADFYSIPYRFNYMTFLDFKHSAEVNFSVGSTIRIYGLR